MSVFEQLASLAWQSADALDGADAMYLPRGGEDERAVRVVFRTIMQEEMPIADGEKRRVMRQISFSRELPDGIANPQHGDVIYRGDSQTLEAYEIVDILEMTEVSAVVNTRRMHKNEATRSGRMLGH